VHIIVGSLEIKKTWKNVDKTIKKVNEKMVTANRKPNTRCTVNIDSSCSIGIVLPREEDCQHKQ